MTHRDMIKSDESETTENHQHSAPYDLVWERLQELGLEGGLADPHWPHQDQGHRGRGVGDRVHDEALGARCEA
eukprot:scaffold228583_cov14-Prasinocladus_malaysianus.AAC.1